MSVIFKSFDPASFKGEVFFVVDSAIGLGENIPFQSSLFVKGGENLKSFSFVQKLIKTLLDKNFSRNLTLVAVGGGSLLDAVGFAASIYKRGVKIVKVPTTLLAAVDGAIGGKNAINAGEIKNAAGSFYDGEVIIDLSLLKTLGEKDILNGLGEIVKYTFLKEEIDKLFCAYDTQKPLSLPSCELIEACAYYKSGVTERDFFDKGERRVLNAGHTLGHAFEVANKISHGKAVLQGLYFELKLSHKIGIIDKDTLTLSLEKIKKLITPLKTCNIDKILRVCENDKKNGRGISFMLFSGRYGAVEKELTKAQLKEFLEKCFLNL